MQATDYLPAVRNLISDEDKRFICEANWQTRVVHVMRTRKAPTHWPGVFSHHATMGYACPLGLVSQSPKFIPSADELAKALGNPTLSNEIATFMSAWDTRRVSSADLPAILDWHPEAVG
jgi:hypothetical protein